LLSKGHEFFALGVQDTFAENIVYEGLELAEPDYRVLKSRGKVNLTASLGGFLLKSLLGFKHLHE